MFGELAQYSGGIALFAHNCATSVQPGTDNQANGIPGTTERILRAHLQKSNGRRERRWHLRPVNELYGDLTVLFRTKPSCWSGRWKRVTLQMRRRWG